MPYFDYMEVLYSKVGEIILSPKKYNIYTKDPEFLELLANVKYIQLDDEFNLPLDFLPYGIISISTGAKFNQPLNNLPPTVKIIKISCNLSPWYDWMCEFNQELDGLHYGLEELTLINANNGNYHKPLDNLPPTLKTLKILNSLFSEIVDGDSHVDINMLPDSLVSLTLSYVNLYCNVNRLPEHIKSITIKPGYVDSALREKWLAHGYDMIKKVSNTQLVYLSITRT